MSAVTTAADVKARLVGRWPDHRYLHVYEASTNPSRQGTQIDVLILSLWRSDKHQLDAVEVKVSYSDWCKEWKRVEWRLTDHTGRVHVSDRKFTPDRLAYFTGGDTGYYWRLADRPPDDFTPTVERVETIDAGKNQAWRDCAHRFWIAAPEGLAVRIAQDVRDQPAMAGWGVLGVSDTATHVVVKPTVHADRPALSHQQWLGIVRASADSGLQALDRARRAGEAEGRRRAELHHQRLAAS